MVRHLRPLSFFASIGGPLRRYFIEIAKVENETIESDLAVEAAERLMQIDFLIGEITNMQRQALNLGWQSHELWLENMKNQVDDPREFLSTREGQESFQFSELADEAFFKLKLASESFYYFAARLIGVLKYFPHFKNLDVAGVRNVRNHLIEHPQKRVSGVTQYNWSLDIEAGPSFKNLRRPNQEHVPTDSGLFHNAFELRDILEKKFDQIFRSF